MKIVHSKRELRETLAPYRAGSIGFVPTMGYLHDGHLSLMSTARARCETVVASIFVNPLQFGPNEDLDVYPRDTSGDTEKARDAGVDVLWMPESAQIYHDGHGTIVKVAHLTDHLCGAHRPGHFDGVTTIVAKLLNTVGPTYAFFGQKDYQQLAVVRRMVRDLDFPVEIAAVPTVRESDGLAMSSRNVFLSNSDRAAAGEIIRGLCAAHEQFSAGERRAARLVETVSAQIRRSGRAEVDYVECVDALTLEGLVEVSPQGDAVIAVAARFGSVRLIDNILLDQPAPAFTGSEP